MMLLGFDTATPSTAVGLRLADGETIQVRDDPRPGEHPGHATRLLAMTGELLAAAGVAWSALDRIAVGVGPGAFTGLRVGVATARGLAQSLAVELVGVPSLRALAQAAAELKVRTGDVAMGDRMARVGDGEDPGMRAEDRREGLLAVIDARRGEVFAAAYALSDRRSPSELVAAHALAPDHVGGLVAQAQERAGARGWRWSAVGDGAVRFRAHLEKAGVAVARDRSPLHLVGAEAICDLGAQGPAGAYDEIVPNYGRRPDAETALERVVAREGSEA